MYNTYMYNTYMYTAIHQIIPWDPKPVGKSHEIPSSSCWSPREKSEELHAVGAHQHAACVHIPEVLFDLLVDTTMIRIYIYVYIYMYIYIWGTCMYVYIVVYI